jgi:hypothetical protein
MLPRAAGDCDVLAAAGALASSRVRAVANVVICHSFAGGLGRTAGGSWRPLHAGLQASSWKV